MIRLLFIIVLLLTKPVVAQNEQIWIDKYCPNNQAHTVTVLVDCLTDEYAIEFDFSNKWAEAIGQSLYYASQTNRNPAIFILCQNKRCKTHLHKLNSTIDYYNLNIKVMTNEH